MQGNHVVIEGYKHISTVVGNAQAKMDKIRSGEVKPLVTSSEKETDKIGGYFPSDQIVIAGRTGTGKTVKILHDLYDFANPVLNQYYSDKLIILYDSWEMADWRNILRLMSREAGVQAKSLLDYKQKLTEERYLALRDIANRFRGLPVYISTYPMSVSKWEVSKKQIQGANPKKYIVNVFDHTRLVLKSTEKSEEELITQLMLAGMRLKNQFGMINFFASQMNRNIETNAGRDKMGTYTPVSSDIFGSDSAFQCADIVMALHRPGMYKIEMFEGIPTGYKADNPDADDNLLLECILKQREGWTGNLIMKHNMAHNSIVDYPPLVKSALIGFDNNQAENGGF